MAYNAVNIGGIIHGNVNADVFLSIYSESIYCRNIGIAMCRPVRGKLSIKISTMIGDGLSHVSYRGIVNCDRMWPRTRLHFQYR